MVFQSLQKFSRSVLYFLPHSTFYILRLYKKWEFREGESRTSIGLQEKTVQASLLRNTIKFFPWQIGHMGTIHGFYSEFDSLSIILSFLATLLAVALLVMMVFRKDKRHLGDLIAHTQVQLKGD